MGSFVVVTGSCRSFRSGSASGTIHNFERRSHVEQSPYLRRKHLSKRDGLLHQLFMPPPSKRREQRTNQLVSVPLLLQNWLLSSSRASSHLIGVTSMIAIQMVLNFELRLINRDRSCSLLARGIDTCTMSGLGLMR